MGNIFQRQLGNHGHFDPERKLFFKTRKFGEFSAGEQVAMGRVTASTLTSQAYQPNPELANIHATALGYLAPVQQSSMDTVLSSVGQSTTRNPEGHGRSLNLQQSASLSRPESLSTALQPSENSEYNAPVSNWPHVLLSTCVVGVAAVAVATGYACSTVIRGAMNVGQFIYANRENIHQTCTTCTQAVQSTYNAAKRRMVSVRIPSQSHRRYAPSPTSQGRNRQRRYFWQHKRSEQSSQSSRPVASTISPEGMEGIEYSVPPSPVVSDSHFHLSTSHDLPSDVPRMTGALPCETSPSSCVSSLEQDHPKDHPATSPLSSASTPVEMEPAEERIISYEESVFSDDLDDDDVVPVMKGKDITGVAELFSKDNGQSDSTCLELERSWSLQNKFASTASFAETSPTEHLREGNSPHVAFYESPRTGRPVNRSKKFVKDEPIDFPVDDSTFNAPPVIELIESPTQKEQDAESSQTHGPIRNRSPSPEGLTTPFLALKVSGRWGSMRANEIKKKAAKLRQEKEAAEAAQRARLAAEEAAREEEERLKRGYRRIPKGKMIQPLDAKWEQSVQSAMASPSMQEVLAITSNGTQLTRRDLGTLKVVKGRDPSHGWLNDEIVSACLQQVVEYGLQASNHKAGETPKYFAFNTFFYTNLREKGAQSVRRWATRAKIGKENLLKVERVFIPVHSGAHWTLLVVSPIAHTIEYFDSLGGPARPYILNAKAWLREELGKLFKEEEWTVPTGSVGAGPQQSNSSDCGVFTCTNARMVVLGVDPIAYAGSDMELQRTRMVAELLNGGLKGDFEPRVVF